MKVRREFFRISLFTIGSSVVVASIIAAILLLLTSGESLTAESREFAAHAFVIVVFISILPIAVFSVLTRYTLTKLSIKKRASFYGFCNMITAFYVTVYLVSGGKSGPVPGFNLETLIVYSIPALICFFAWTYLAIKFLNSGSLLQNNIEQ